MKQNIAHEDDADNNLTLPTGMTLIQALLWGLYTSLNVAMELSDSDAAAMEACILSVSSSATNGLPNGFGTMLDVIMSSRVSSRNSASTMRSKMAFLERSYMIFRPDRTLKVRENAAGGLTLRFDRR